MNLQREKNSEPLRITRAGSQDQISGEFWRWGKCFVLTSPFIERRDRVRRERRWSTAGGYPPGNWFTTPGSNQSSRGGSETAEASGAESRSGDLASRQAVT